MRKPATMSPVRSSDGMSLPGGPRPVSTCARRASTRIRHAADELGRQLGRRRDHGVRERERIRRGRVVRIRERDHAHPGRVRRPDPVRGVLDGGAAPARRRAGAPPRGRRPAPACRARPPRTRRRRRRAGRSPRARARPRSAGGSRTRRRRAGTPAPAGGPRRRRRRSAAAARGSARASADDLGVDLLRRLGQPELVVHVRATTRASSCPSSPPARRRASARRAPARAARARRPRPARSRR